MSRDLILLALSLMTWGVGEGMFLFFQPLYLQELGASPVAIGGILGLVGVGMTVAHLPAGYLSDRIGRRPMMIAAWMMGLGSAWIMALAPNLTIFVTGSILYGMTSFVISPMNSYITAARGSQSVGRAITLVSATYNIGAILGPLLGGWVGAHAGLHANFLIAAVIFILSNLIILFIRPQPVQKSVHETESANLKKMLQELLNKRFITYLFVIFIVMYSMYLPQPLSQNFLQNERGLGLMQIGKLISLRSVGIVILNLVIGQLNAGLGFLLAQVAMALFTILLWQGHDILWYASGYVLMGSYQTARSLATAQGRTLVKTSNMGLAYGMIETVSALVIILAPPLAGHLYAQKPDWIYSISLVLISLALLYTIRFSPVRAGEKTQNDPEDLEWTQS